MLPEASNLLPYLILIFAYLLGSVSTAILTCRLMGLPDPRSGGSGNPGATNVLRLGGKKAAMITLIGDMLKGLLAVLIARLAGLDLTWMALAGLVAFLGHLYPIYFHFKGGKGVATAIGVYLGLHLWAGLLVCLTWLFVAKVLKTSSLSALIATALAPVYFYGFTQHLPLTLILLVMTLLIFWRHRSNVQNMLTGQESKIQLDNKEPSSQDNNN